MSEELTKSEEITEEKIENVEKIDNNDENKEKTKKVQEKPKPVVKKKEIEITESYQYNGEGDLIIDKPSQPLIRKEPIMKEQKPAVKSNKELYESYVKELVNFSLSINNEILYDSSLDKLKEYPVKFENDYFILYGKKYSYNGLRIQKINKK